MKPEPDEWAEHSGFNVQCSVEGNGKGRKQKAEVVQVGQRKIVPPPDSSTAQLQL